MTTDHDADLDALSTEELAALVRAGVVTLGRRGSTDAFIELLQISPVVGEAIGEVARALGQSGSWAQVGQLAGTTKQAAWARWRG